MHYPSGIGNTSVAAVFLLTVSKASGRPTT
jgi:hypothetical protein